MPSNYLDLQRKFVEVDETSSEESAYFGRKKVGWREVLSHRTVVIRAQANFGKTTEMREQCNRLRSGGHHAIFVQLRRVRTRQSLDEALLEVREDHECFQAWGASPGQPPLTVFLDSLDEASPGDDGDLAYWLRKVTIAVNWPKADVRWVISTRPALLTPTVLSELRRIFNRGKTVVPATQGDRDGHPELDASDAVFRERVVDPEALIVFQMTELDKRQACRYLREHHDLAEASEVIQLANRRGLGSLTGNPGGLATLAEIDLLSRPPDSLTDIVERVTASFERRLAQDSRIRDAGSEGLFSVRETIRRLATASQLCQLINIELPQDGLLGSPDALSARLISAGRISEAVLQAVLGAHGFIDVGNHQVKIFPDELPPYFAAAHLSALVLTPETAHRLIKALSWEAPSGERGVDRRLLPMMGWLATLNPHCRAEILKFDPQALAFFGDLRNSEVAQRDVERALRDAVRELARRGEWPGRGVFRLTSENYWQAGSARTAAVVADLFREYSANAGVRDVLLNIAAYSGLTVLRDFVLNQHDWNYEVLLTSVIDTRYILELEQAEDLQSIAAALLCSQTLPESIASALIEKLGWTYLRAKDLTTLAAKYFARGHGGFHLASSLTEVLAPEATDEQLWRLTRGLVLCASRTRERPGRRTHSLHQANERLVELSAELLAALLTRPNAASTENLATLCLLLFRVIREAHHGSADVADLAAALTVRSDVRRVYLHRLVQMAEGDGEVLEHLVFGYGSLCEATLEDAEAVGATALRETIQKIEQQRAERKSRPQTRADTWSGLELPSQARAELEEKAPGIRDGSALKVFAWLASWLLQTNQTSRYGEVEFGAFEQQAGPELAAAVREGLSRVWRVQPPFYKEDEPNTTYHITAAGLQGLHLELGHGTNLPALTEEEVRQAVRYAAFEINGFPAWFWPVVRAHEEVAGDELVRLTAQANDGAVSRQHAEHLFSNLEDAPESVQKRLAPLAWDALAQSVTTREFVVDRMLRAVVASNVVSQQDFETLAWRRIGEAPGPNSPSTGTNWAEHWLRQYPRSFVERMLDWRQENEEAAKAFLYRFASEHGPERGALLAQVATESDDGVDALGAFYVLVLDVVRRHDDLLHADGGVYPISGRDNAQDFRDGFIPAIVEAKTQRAYDVLEWLKLKLGPERTSDIVRAQYQLREGQLERTPLDQRDFEKFERDFARPITGRLAFDLALQNAVLAVKYDIEQGEHSLRRFFSALNFGRTNSRKAGLALESDFQQLLASELKHHARGAFVVQREPETAEHNRRDVHCSKESLDLTASIELKMSERWTLPDYLEALEHQLVGQYMRQRNANTGFLVIVLQRERTWSCPATGRALSFDEIVTMLQARADVLVREDSSKFLRVIGINAVSPKNFRETRRTRQKPQAGAAKAVQIRKTKNLGRAERLNRKTRTR